MQKMNQSEYRTDIKAAIFSVLGTFKPIQNANVIRKSPCVSDKLLS